MAPDSDRADDRIRPLNESPRRPSFRRIFPKELPNTKRNSPTVTPGRDGLGGPDAGTLRGPGADGREPRTPIVLYDPPRNKSPKGADSSPPRIGKTGGTSPARPVSQWGGIGDPVTPVISGGADTGTPDLPLIGGSGGGYDDGYGDGYGDGYHDGHHHDHHDHHHYGHHHHYWYGLLHSNWYGYNDWWRSCGSGAYYSSGWSFGIGFAWDGWSFSLGYNDHYRPRYVYYGHHHNPWHYRTYRRPWNYYDVHYRTCSVTYSDPWYDDAYVHDVNCAGACGSASCYAAYANSYLDGGDAGWGGTLPSTYVGSGAATNLLGLAEPTYESIDDRVATAWGLLVAGAIESARDEFDLLLEVVPWEAEIHLGYGLASAMLGDDTTAVAAVRQAIATDARVIERVPADVALDGPLLDLVERWSERIRRDLGDLDALFMVGALRATLGDFPVAFFAVDAAARSGDTHESTQNLKALLEVELYDDL